MMILDSQIGLNVIQLLGDGLESPWIVENEGRRTKGEVKDKAAT